jgi:hypothetical protein
MARCHCQGANHDGTQRPAPGRQHDDESSLQCGTCACLLQSSTCMHATCAARLAPPVSIKMTYLAALRPRGLAALLEASASVAKLWRSLIAGVVCASSALLLRLALACLARCLEARLALLQQCASQEVSPQCTYMPTYARA